MNKQRYVANAAGGFRRVSFMSEEAMENFNPIALSVVKHTEG